ncbi:putative NAD/FAD-binding protein [Saccharothrix australiensis]|uniref:Putative NAD/FAD-binding protein n=1 Tax=Saccharothrix australiensis TaxID=2072 RepID=A0A495VYZ6_9PSEU|nr:putative NAD/FAD-binding protein [Saccharothrix australiensis]
MRVGIVGAGVAGLVTAWLVEEACDVVVVESRRRVGGNARSAAGFAGGAPAVFDLGAQEIAADDSSPHTALLAALGVDERHRLDVPSSHTFSVAGRPTPLLVGPHPGRPADLDRGPAWAAVRSFLDDAGEPSRWDWDVPFGSLLDGLSPPPDARDVLCALPAALFGCPLADVPALSARVALTYVLGVAADPVAEVRLLRGGMEGLAWALAGRLAAAEVRTGCPVERVERTGDGYVLSDAAGRRDAVDHLVLAVPPPVALRLLPASMTGPDGGWRVLRRFAYRPLRYALHLDPAYLPADRSSWSTTNVLVHDGRAEITTWYGPSHGVDVFKSQLTHRSAPPRRVVATSAFDALPVTTDVIGARRALDRLQGRENLHFAGHHTTGSGDQESAIASAAAVARRLAPGSSRLRHLPTP